MTAHKHLKARIRARMQKTGERYATARRHMLQQADRDLSFPCHFPGNVPASTALRSLLARADLRAPHTNQPFSEGMLFGIAGGIGIGVFSFFYEREDIATFFIAGRHQWHDDLAYLQGALEGFGITPVVVEAGGANAAAKQLKELLDAYGLCVAWVDLAMLPHRAMPAAMSGSGYHVVTVYAIDSDAHTAQIGDLGDEPITIGLDALASARARIKKQRNRLLAVAPANQNIDLAGLVWRGLRRCANGLLHPTLLQAQSNARLEALQTWAERLHGSQGNERWERVYRPGHNLWRELCAIYDVVEHYGTGGGLCRPLFGDFLSEATAALGEPSLAALAGRYAALGRAWSALADAALPDDVAMMREAKRLYAHKAELLHSGGSAEEVGAAWQRLEALEAEARAAFPLSDGACAELRAQLQARVVALYADEVAAFEALLAALRERGAVMN